MKIGIDIRCLSEGRRTGVEEYTINLLKKIFAEDKRNEYILFFNSWNKNTKVDLSWYRKYSNVSLKRFSFPNKILNLLLWYFRWPKIDKLLGGVDIFFAPNMNFVALSKNVKFVLTVHDLSFEYFPETFSWKRRWWHFFVNPHYLVKRADKIIAVSNSTKNDILKKYKIPSDKIKVIYNGVSEKMREIDRNDFKLLKIKEKYNLPFNFILFLGTFEPRKNIVGLVKSYELLRKKYGEKVQRFKLVIAGSSGWKSREIKKSVGKSEFKKDILLLNFVDDNDKVYLYNLASIFVYPSFFEGFGIPPLEAMRCGVNVVASNNSSLPEVVGDGGLLVDADRPDEIAVACGELLLDKKISEKLSYYRFRQLQKFSWQKSAEEFLNLIRSL